MISLDDIRQAAARLEDKVIKTPLIYSPALSRLFNGDIYLKLENLQKTGSFKIRGATHKLLSRIDAIGANGVVAASAGNHAQGVALAARLAGIPATIVMPEWVSITKQEATRAYGGNVVIAGQSVAESLEKAQKLALDHRLLIHPFDDPEIITGQATAGLEICTELPQPDLIIVPVGGGGFISGIASAVKALHASAQIIGVQTTGFCSASRSLQAQKPVETDGPPSIADGICVKKIGRHCFDIMKSVVDGIALVEEEHIAAAILLLLERKKILAEGAGAAPLAALLNGSVVVPSKGKTVLVISGGNVDMPLLGRILNKGLIKGGRFARLRVKMADVPGSLAKLLVLIADLKANVLHIYHDRSTHGVPLYVTHVELELETRGSDHVDQVAQTLSAAGYEVTLR